MHGRWTAFEVGDSVGDIQTVIGAAPAVAGRTIRAHGGRTALEEGDTEGYIQTIVAVAAVDVAGDVIAAASGTRIIDAVERIIPGSVKSDTFSFRIIGAKRVLIATATDFYHRAGIVGAVQVSVPRAVEGGAFGFGDIGA